MEEEYEYCEDGDIHTEDYRKFYQDGKLILDISPEDDYKDKLKEHMENSQFWPNVWWVSDHGNFHLITFDKQ